jgi:hypothetical protein
VEELVPKLEAAGRTAASATSPDEAGGEEIDGDDASSALRVEEGASDGETLPF